MSVHLPASLPLRARIKSTLNIRRSNRGTIAEANRTARRVVDYLHQRILENPDRHQRYSHEEIGAALGIDPRKVRLGLAHAGASGITVYVTEACRAAIKSAQEERGPIL